MVWRFSFYFMTAVILHCHYHHCSHYYRDLHRCCHARNYHRYTPYGHQIHYRHHLYNHHIHYLIFWQFNNRMLMFHDFHISSVNIQNLFSITSLSSAFKFSFSFLGALSSLNTFWYSYFVKWTTSKYCWASLCFV